MGPGGRRGPGEEGGACKGSEARERGWKGVRMSRLGAGAPSVLWGLGGGRIREAAKSSLRAQAWIFPGSRPRHAA